MTPEPGEIELSLDGEGLIAHAGQTIAAAAAAAGHWQLGSSRTGGVPRGLFCGAGWCTWCRVTVDGVPGRTACQVTVQPGMVVLTLTGDPDLSRTGRSC